MKGVKEVKRKSENKEIYQLMDPKVDFVFKSIFGNEKKPEILISFLNAVFGYKGENEIVKVKVENPNIEKEDIDDKYSILDIKATANDNTVIDIEIQISNQYDMIPRTLYYLSKLIEGQLKEKGKYTSILKSVTINILNFKILKENKRVHNSFVFKEKETNEVLTDLAEIHFLEIPKLEEQEKLDMEDLLNDWLLFIENPESEAIEMITKKVSAIKEAKETLKVLSLNKEARIVYESRQRALREKESILGAAEEAKKEGSIEGIKEGIKEGKFKIAMKMLSKGKTIEEIVEMTELSRDEIEKLK